MILGLLAERIDRVREKNTLKDPKTRLQEYLQGRKQPLPEYTVLEVQGMAHDQLFRVSCRVEGLVEETIGEGVSRRKAEQGAAEQALRLLENG